MAQRTCSLDGCSEPHRARGLCRRHYTLTHGMHDAVCATCGQAFKGYRTTAKFCSDVCKGQAYTTKCILPLDHPVLLEINRVRVEREAAIEAARQTEQRAETLARRVAWSQPRECRGCACIFSPLFTPTMLDCSARCARRVARRARRARERGAAGSWVWSEFMRIARRFDYCCAYCDARPGRLDPDHVVPLSRGGYDSATNLLPACAECNRSKGAMTLAEWTEWRALRALAPRRTRWTVGDPRYRHLTQALLAA